MIIFGNNYFADFFNNTIKLNNNPDLSEPVADHPDMNLCIIDHTVFLPKNSFLRDIFIKHGYSVIHISETLKPDYPYDVRLNCKCIQNTVILNPKTVSKEILKYCNENNKKIIYVPQGYAACSILALNEKAFITSDKGIANALSKEKLSVLLISPGYINIKKYNYGFIGGASGFINEILYFFGDITCHPDYLKIKHFIENNNTKFKYFKENLTDIGGVFQI